MKDITRTVHNTFIVELTMEEYKSLSKLLPKQWAEGFRTGIASLGLDERARNTLYRAVAMKVDQDLYKLTFNKSGLILSFDEWTKEPDLLRRLKYIKGMGKIISKQIMDAVEKLKRE